MAIGRINKILILQGWAILWVVIGHAPLLPISEDGQPDLVIWLYNIAYSFHMPLFIFISGYLFRMTRIEKPMTYKAMIWDKMKRLGIPFLLFTIIAMFVKSLFAVDMIRPTTISAGTLLHAILYPGDGPLGELWFIATLMWYFALRPLWALNGWGRYVAIALTALLYCLPDIPTSDFLSYKQALHYSLFFCLGAYARCEKILDGFSLRSCAIMVGVTLACTLICGIATFSADIALPLMGIIISILFATGVDRFMPRTFFTFREYSYQIYLMGIFAQIAVKILYKHGIIPCYGIGYGLCLLCGLYLPIGVSLVVKKINNKYLNACIGLK